MPTDKKKPGRKPRVTDDGLLDVFRATTDPVLSTAEVADALPIKRRGTLNRLRDLEDDGTLDSKQIGGRNTVWWLVDERDVSDTGRRSPATADPAPVDEERDTPPESDAVGDALEDVDFPAGREREACSAAVYAARDYLREHGKATMREFVQEVMPEHPCGYDVPQLEPGERYRGAWWRKVVKPGLEALPDVESPPTGGSDWTYTGENDE